jgi:hypothetical protein
MLHVARCMLHVGRCMLHVVCYTLHVFTLYVARWMLDVAHCILHVVRCMLHAGCWSLYAAYMLDVACGRCVWPRAAQPMGAQRFSNLKR